MKNLGQMMKQAQEMQSKMAEMQESWPRSRSRAVRRRHGQGDAQRQGRARGVKIDPALVDPDDVEMLEDLIIAAVNDGQGQGRGAW